MKLWSQGLHQFLLRCIYGCIYSCLIATIILTGVSVLSVDSAWAASDDGLLVPDSRFQNVRTQPELWKSLRKRCDKELNEAPHAIANLQPATHYSSSGVNHDETARYLNIDAGIAYRAAICFRLTDDVAYARHTQAIADAWGNTLQTVEKGQGSAEVNFNMPQVIIAASWVRHSENWEDKAFRNMLKKVAAPVTHAYHANNHGNWGVLLDTSIAAYLGDLVNLEKAKARWQTLMLKQVAYDGAMPLEICRTNTNHYCDGADKGVNGISYTHYTLLPTALTAEIFYQRGQDLYQTPAGARLSLAYRQALAWTLHPEQFPYYVSNQGNLNGVRNIAYLAILQRHFEMPEARELQEQGQLGMNGFEMLLLMGEKK